MYYKRDNAIAIRQCQAPSARWAHAHCHMACQLGKEGGLLRRSGSIFWSLMRPVSPTPLTCCSSFFSQHQTTTCCEDTSCSLAVMPGTELAELAFFKRVLSSSMNGGSGHLACSTSMASGAHHHQEILQ